MTPRKRRYQSEFRRAKAELNRTRILMAARKTFVTRGFERATIRDVAELARVSVVACPNGLLLVEQET